VIKRGLIDSGWCLWLLARINYEARLNMPPIVQAMQMKKHTFIL